MLAHEAAMYASTFAARFTERVGQPAMTYLTRWRMNIAHTRLSEGGASVSQVAADLGYSSEAAFAPRLHTGDRRDARSGPPRTTTVPAPTHHGQRGARGRQRAAWVLTTWRDRRALPTDAT